jgi:hypothetical protein
LLVVVVVVVVMVVVVVLKFASRFSFVFRVHCPNVIRHATIFPLLYFTLYGGGAVSLRCSIPSHLLLPLFPLSRPATRVIYVSTTSTKHAGPAWNTNVQNSKDLTPLNRKHVWLHDKLYSYNPTHSQSSYSLTALQFRLFLTLLVHLKTVIASISRSRNS